MTIGCAWCSPSGDGTDGICAHCALVVFGVDLTTIQAEQDQAEQEQEQAA